MSNHPVNRRDAVLMGAAALIGWPRGASGTSRRLPRTQDVAIRWQDNDVAPDERMAGREPGSPGERFQPRRGQLLTTPYDSDPFVVAVETKLKCTCGCLHNVYECRNVDFQCGFWPTHHADIVEQATAGWTAREIIDEYVRAHGAEYLMAPAAEGFNLVAYVLPATLIATAGALIGLYLKRVAHPAAAALAAGAGTGTSTLSDEQEKILAEELAQLES